MFLNNIDIKGNGSDPQRAFNFLKCVGLSQGVEFSEES